MNNDKKISIFFLIFVAFFIGCFYYASQNNLRGPVKKNKEEKEIKTYAIQTHEYFSDLECLKYLIDTEDELKVFNSKFDVDLKLDKVDFDDYRVFVQLETVSSGGIQKEVTDVILDDTITFVIKTKSGAAMTDDMALWYYVAIIPNEQLKDVNYNAYEVPSNVIDVANPSDTYDDYIIETDNKYLTMRDDGGSNTNVYYKIDTLNHIVTKHQDDYHANLTGTPETIKEVLYEKSISNDTIAKIKKIYETEELNHDTDLPYKINDKDIYDSVLINELKNILTEIDNA